MSFAKTSPGGGHRPLEILAGIEPLLARDYTIDDIIPRTGLFEKYVRDIVSLREKGRGAPDQGGAKRHHRALTTALQNVHAKHDDENLGDMLEEAYKTCQLKGHQITDAKRLIEKRREKGPKTGGDPPKSPNSAHSLIKTYQHEVARRMLEPISSGCIWLHREKPDERRVSGSSDSSDKEEKMRRWAMRETRPEQ